MAELDIKQIDHIAKLSKLELTEEEKRLYREQLSSIVSYVEQLSKVDTENVTPLSNVTGLFNVERQDEIKESNLNYNDIAKNAPDFRVGPEDIPHKGNFIVPGVFE